MPTLWPHVPSEFRETLETFTDVRRTQTGEFRDSLKDPTQIFTLSHSFLDAEAARADGLYRSNPTGTWYVPVWCDATRFVGTITSGATSISVETDADYRAGGKAVVLLSDQVAEVVDVSSASGGTLNLSGGVSRTYVGTAGLPVIVAPVRTCYAPAGFDRSDVYGLATMSIRFIATDNTDLAAAIYPTHRTYDVVTDISVVFSALQGGMSQAVDFIDNGFGTYDVETLETYSRARGTLALVDVSYTDRHAQRTWLHRARGRDRPFWISTWKNDLPLRDAVTAVATSIKVQKTTPTLSEMVGRSIQFRLTDGTLIQRQVTGAAAVGGDGTSMFLTISATGQAVPTSAVVSLLTLVRFDTDQIELTHMNTGDGFLTHFSAPVLEVAA